MSRQQIVAFLHYRPPQLAVNVGGTKSFQGLMGGRMQANKVSAVMAAAIASVMLAFTTAPSVAQTTEVRPVSVRAAAVVRPPARVTVRRRSYLDPGTETKAHAEHRTDYAHPVESGFAPFRYSTLFKNGPALPFTHDRMPFPNCLDLGGFCQ